MAAAQRDDFTNEVARRLRGSGRKGLVGSNVSTASRYQRNWHCQKVTQSLELSWFATGAERGWGFQPQQIDLLRLEAPAT
jgi:hypothetical protein